MGPVLSDSRARLAAALALILIPLVGRTGGEPLFILVMAAPLLYWPALYLLATHRFEHGREAAVVATVAYLALGVAREALWPVGYSDLQFFDDYLDRVLLWPALFAGQDACGLGWPCPPT